MDQLTRARKPVSAVFLLAAMLMLAACRSASTAAQSGPASTAGSAAATASSACAAAYQQPASWNTGRTVSKTPGIADYIEPLNVVISACSTVPLSDIQAALGDWKTEYTATKVTLAGAHLACISPETADVTGHGYVTQQKSWRLQGCAAGNVLSLTGREGHVRLWNQPAAGSKYGAWFIAASYETACASVDGKLYPLAGQGSNHASGAKVFHCINGGPGTHGTDGYDGGAKTFASDVVKAAQGKGWKVTQKTVTRPVAAGPDTGEDGAKFSGTVQVLTLTR
jgi:hypothetical protein